MGLNLWIREFRTKQALIGELRLQLRLKLEKKFIKHKALTHRQRWRSDGTSCCAALLSTIPWWAPSPLAPFPSPSPCHYLLEIEQRKLHTNAINLKHTFQPTHSTEYEGLKVMAIKVKMEIKTIMSMTRMNTWHDFVGHIDGM